MTGIERLRAFARRMDELSVWPGGAKLLDIAGQIEREHDAEVADSPYDAILPEDREAVAWVRERGGLEAVEARLMPEGYEWPRYESGEPLRYEDRYVYDGREREVWHVDFDSYGESTILNKDGTRSHPDKGERVKRPTPKVLDADGVEIRVGDTVWHTKTGAEYRVLSLPDMDKGAWVTTKTNPNDNLFLDLAVLTHRAPVLASDGKPLREGETVWDVETGDGYVVERIYSGTTEPDFPGHTVACRRPDDIVTHMFKPSQLTHERPVLDADGVPIKVGDTVYPKYPYEEQDRQVESAEVVYIHRRGRVDIQAKYATGMSFRQQVDAKQLTHTKPEHPKRCRDCAHWQKDPTADNMGVCWFFYHEHEGQDCYAARRADIGACEEFMPRAKALAERERGE